MTTPIPQPRTIPFLGNATTLEAEVPLRSMHALAKEYGEIFQLDLPGKYRRPLLCQICNFYDST
jgi:cytochrome P450 / NADPH-cytochrome P450 reductase